MKPALNDTEISFKDLFRQNQSSLKSFNGNVTGRNLLVVPGKIIVQSWRGNVWKKEEYLRSR